MPKSAKNTGKILHSLVADTKSESKNFSINSKDFVMVKGLDTYVNPGAHPTVLRYTNREQFLKDHPLVATLLKRESTNPVVWENGREGECYFTNELLALLIYTTLGKDTCIVDNDKKKLEVILKSFKLKDGNDEKIIFTEGIHSVMLYIRQVDDVTKCLLMDSTPRSSNSEQFAALLTRVFANHEIYISKDPMQTDYFNCQIFVFKAMRHCIKYGVEIFNHLKPDGDYFKSHSILEFKLDDLLPSMRKMSQTSDYLDQDHTPSEKFASIKLKTTETDYLKTHVVKIDGKNKNVAASIKRYQYLHELEKWLEIFLDKEEKAQISEFGIDPLPARLAGIVSELTDKYHEVLAPVELVIYEEKPVYTSVKYPALAMLCARYDKHKNFLVDCEKILDSGIKKFDVLPDCVILGDELNAEYKGYSFHKLAPDDFSVFIMSEGTKSCLRVGKEGEACVRAGVTSPYSAFYVIEDAKQNIVAHAWVWLGKKGAIVFDSIYSRGEEYDSLVFAFISKASQRFLEAGFSLVNMGISAEIPFKLKRALVHTDKSFMLEACGYSQATEQLLVRREDSFDLLSRLRESVHSIKQADPDKLYSLFLYLYRSGVHLFDFLYATHELALLQAVIEKINPTQLANILQLKDPQTGDVFSHSLAKPELVEIAAIIAKKQIAKVVKTSVPLKL